jgi:primosomal protein N'
LALVTAAPLQQKKSVQTHTHAAKKASAAKVYICDKCDVASTKAGKCPGCTGQLAPANATLAYGCPSCGTASAKAGACPSCKGPMQKVAVTYACKHCHTTSTKAGNCAKCGMALTKEVIPLAKM